MIFSIILFFLLSIGFGFIIDLVIKEWNASFFEKLVIRIGFGILVIPILGVFLNTLKIMIYWPIFLVIAILVTVAALYLRKEILIHDLDVFKNFKLKKSSIYGFFVFIMFIISAYMYIKGSFNYPWFENGDPYGYALIAKYIALEKTYDVSYYFAHYAYPYTQGYQIFMGLLHQTNDSIYWNLKFFNSLIVSFSILFFYYFTKKFTGKVSSAFWATFVLAAIPAWLGHFVFSLNFNMVLMLILFYALISIKNNKNWKYIVTIAYGSIIINHFYTSVVITALFLIYVSLKVLISKNFSKDYFDSFFLGLGIGLFFWIPALWKHYAVLKNGAQLGGMNTFLPIFELIINSTLVKVILVLSILIFFLIYWKHQIWFKYVKKLFDIKNAKYIIYLTILIMVLLVLIVPSEKLVYAKGSASRVYSADDFFIAKQSNMINNPIGIGMVIMSIFVIGMFMNILNFKKLFKKHNFNLLVAFTWSIFTFLGVMGASLSIGFVPFRMWTFFGFCLAIIVGITINSLLNSIKSMPINKSIKTLVKILIVLILLVSVYHTSFSPKYWHNTAVWPEHQIMVPESQQLFIWMREGGLPKDSMVLPLCNDPSLVLGYDMLTKPWSFDDLTKREFYLNSLNQTLETNYQFLKSNGYEYTILGMDCVAKYNVDGNLLTIRINEMMDSDQFELIRSTKTEYLFKIK